MSLFKLPANEAEFDRVVNQALEKFDVPGISIAVIANGKTIHCRGYGMRDLEASLPVTEHTIFPIASNTKPFTGFLLAQLVEEGKADWDDPVIHFLSEFRMWNEELTQQVTLRDLLAHRTGVPRHDTLWYAIRDLSEEDTLQILPLLEPQYNLRESFLYNNLMYVVAGRVIRNLTNHFWEEELISRIFTPLEMKNSGVFKPNRENLAQPYAKIGGKLHKLPFYDHSSTLAASGIFSTSSDLAKWVQVQLGSPPKLIQQATLDEMHTIHMPFSSQESGYGISWEVSTFKGRKWVSHGGITEGFHSKVSFLPDEQIGLVILTNSSTHGPCATAFVEKKLYDYLLGLDEDEKDKVEVPSLKKYEGQYLNEAYGTMQITAELNSLRARLGKMDIELIHKEGEVFVGTFPSLQLYGVSPFIEFSFSSNKGGRVNQLIVPFESFHSAPPILFDKQ